MQPYRSASDTWSMQGCRFPPLSLYLPPLQGITSFSIVNFFSVPVEGEQKLLGLKNPVSNIPPPSKNTIGFVDVYTCDCECAPLHTFLGLNDCRGPLITLQQRGRKGNRNRFLVIANRSLKSMAYIYTGTYGWTDGYLDATPGRKAHYIESEGLQNRMRGSIVIF